MKTLLVSAALIFSTLFFLAAYCRAQNNDTVPVSVSDMNAQFPEAPERNDKVFDKKFFFAMLASGAGNSLDRYATISKEGRCFEGNNGFPEIVSAKEEVWEGVADFGAVFIATAALKLKPPKHFKWIPFLVPAYDTALHLHGAYQWYHEC